MKFNKKAALDLSVNAIVVIVIAFVVLGLALTFTRTIFRSAGDKIPEVISLTELESVPNVDDLITMTKNIEVFQGKEKELKIGFYNKEANRVKVKPLLSACYNKTGDPVRSGSVNVNPGFAVGSFRDAPAGGAIAFGAMIKPPENPYTIGKYVCTLQIIDNQTIPNVKAQEEFYLNIIS